MSALENQDMPSPQYSVFLVDGVPPPTTEKRRSIEAADHPAGNCS